MLFNDPIHQMFFKIQFNDATRLMRGRPLGNYKDLYEGLGDYFAPKEWMGVLTVGRDYRGARSPRALSTHFRGLGFLAGITETIEGPENPRALSLKRVGLFGCCYF